MQLILLVSNHVPSLATVATSTVNLKLGSYLLERRPGTVLCERLLLLEGIDMWVFMTTAVRMVIYVTLTEDGHMSRRCHVDK